MNRVRRKCGSYICLLLCLVLLFTQVPIQGAAVDTETESTAGETSSPESESKLVRVGWFEDSYNITGANGERSGYGYEYQQSVAACTGWRYDYVKAGWSELLKMMQSGELDLMSGVSYTEERAESMLYSELPMGEERYYLYADLNNTDISASNLKSLNGMRIGLLEGSIHATQFYEWEEEHGLQLQHIFITGLEDALEKLAAHELDCVVSTETPQLVEAGLSAIALTGGSDIYFVVNKDRPDLKEELDTAMRRIASDKPFYADELYQRYLSAVASAVLSGEEQEWLDQHGSIRIGFLLQDQSVSEYDESSEELTGILLDYIGFAMDCLENEALQFDVVGFQSQEEQLQAMKDGEIDMIFHFTQNPSAAEQNGFILSNTVFETNMAAVTARDYFDENQANSVAIEKGDLLTEWYISYKYPEWSVVEYDTCDDAVQAVRNGQEDCFVARSGQLTQYLEDKRVYCVTLTQSNVSSFAVNLDDTILLSILNNTLKAMPSSMLTGALSMYDTSVRKVTVADFIKDNLLMVAVVLLTVFLLILTVILTSLRSSRISEAKARKAAEESLELNRKLQISQQELQSALQRAESASRAKTTFLNNMSHDIRTPMNAIVGIANLMQHENNLSDKMRAYIQKVQLSSRHLLGLINDILDMSRIESDEVMLNEEAVSLAEQISQIDSIIRAQTNEREHSFHIYVNEIVHEYLICDGVRLRQIFLNLLSNAVKYTPNGGEISLEIQEVPCDRPGYASFLYTVTDNGYGMTKEFVQHIFEPFTRAENSMTNKVQGTGLGMTITKNIVDLMGGEIRVESEIGKGSRFEVAVTLAVNEHADHEIGAERVLLVSEEEQLIRNVEAAMSESPAQLHAVSTGEEAADWLGRKAADVILLAGCLQDKNLPETVSFLRQKSKDAMLIFCLDYAQEEHVQAMLAASGIDGMVLRPFFLSNLALAIARTRTGSAAEQKNDTILKGMRFLCAEDNELNAEILKEILAMYGADCTICADGREIVQKFSKVKPGDYDAILMDVQMPKMNGLEATRVIRSGVNPLGRTIPIIAMTANAFSEDVQYCLGAGMNAHIAKPIDIAVLEKTLRRFVHKSGFDS